MRQIKFRAWHNNLKEMYNDVHYLDSLNEMISRDYYTVMQYTGLKDKNGVEVYEGDIVELINKDDWIESKNMSGIGEVILDSYLQYSALKKDACCPPLTWGGYKTIEVIGNIHQNPELLK